MALRKALLVGINKYEDSPLRGCVNDVYQIKGLLKQYYGFPDDGFRLVLDEDATKAGITTGLEWLAQGGEEADAVRVFHYSGHGSWVADENGDEPDGRDETLVPVDYQINGMLTDDVLGSIYDRFPTTGNLTLIMDSCHSGTVQRDLQHDIFFRFLPVSREERERADAAAAKFKEDQRQYVFEELTKARAGDITDDELKAKIGLLMHTFEKQRFGKVQNRQGNILLAGCRPDQTSADAHIEGDFHGAFTYYLSKAITESSGRITYYDLARQAGKDLGDNGYWQIPQLEFRGGRDQQPAFRPFT